MLSGRNEAKSLNGLLLTRIGSGQGKGQSRHSPRALFRAAGRIDQNQTSGLFESTGVVEGDLSPHGMADNHEIALSQIVAKRFQVGVEGSDRQFFRVIGVSMTPKIECNHPSVATKRPRDLIPPMGVGAPAMEQHHWRAHDLAPVEGLEKDTGTTLMCESLDSGLHWGRTLTVPRQLLNAPG